MGKPVEADGSMYSDVINNVLYCTITNYVFSSIVLVVSDHVMRINAVICVIIM